MNGLVCFFFQGNWLRSFALTEILWVFLMCGLSLTLKSFIKRRATHFVFMSKRVQDLEIILENIPSGVVGLDKNGGITFLNKAAEKITECGEAEALGKKIGEFLLPEATDKQLPGLIKSIRSLKETVYFNEKEIKARSARKYLISGFICPVHYSFFTGALLVFNDETERRAKENEYSVHADRLKNRYETLLKVLSVLPLGVLVVNSKTSEVVYANRTFREIHDIPNTVPVSRNILYKLMSLNLNYRKYLIEGHRICKFTESEKYWWDNILYTRKGECRNIRLNTRTSPDWENKVITVVEREDRERHKRVFREMIEDYKCITENSIDGIVLINQLGTIVCWNSAMVKLTGIGRENAINKPVWEIEAQIEKKVTEKDNSDRTIDFVQSVKQFAASGEKYSGQKIEIKAVENICSSRVSLVRVYQNFYLNDNRVKIMRVYQDISDLMEVKKRLINQKSFITNLLAASVNMLYIYDLLLKRIVFVSSSKEKLKKESMIYSEGKDLQSLPVHPDDIDSYLNYLENLRTAEDSKSRSHVYRVCFAGEWRWFLRRDMVYCRHEDGNVKQIMGSITDISGFAGHLKGEEVKNNGSENE